jgi:hypothetical protein
MNKWLILKRAALGITITLIIIGIVFIILDILDIAEGYRLYWSIAVINTIFISAISLLTICFSVKNYIKSSSAEILALGAGVFAFGFSIVLYGWLPNSDLNTRISVYDSGVLLASVVYLGGAIYSMKNQRRPGEITKSSIPGIIIIYAGIILIISVITWLASQDIITFFPYRFTEHFATREIVQGIAVVFCVSGAVIYLKKYRDSHDNIYFWYSLGLILFAAGVIFISRGPLESRIAWLGRASQYVAWIYFLIAALSSYKQLINNKAEGKLEV